MQRIKGSLTTLERKLPLLIGGLVAGSLIITLVLVRYELRSSALETAGLRLSSISHQLSDLTGTNTATRLRLLGNIAAEDAVVDLARRPGSDPGPARTQLERLRAGSDSTLPIMLRSRDGDILAVSGTPDAREAGAPPEPQTPAPADGPAYGPLIAEEDRIIYWNTAPVHVDGAVRGHIYQQRAIGSSATAGAIQDLIGSGTQIYFANADGSVWAGIDGRPLGNAQPIPGIDEPYRFRDAAGARFLAFASPLPGTPWVIVSSMPLEAVFAGSNTVLRRLIVTGVIILLAGGFIAWLISRSVTRPLRTLGLAANAIARGDYSHRTRVDRRDEIGLLARSFDSMAAFVDVTHAELERRFAEAQSLAAQLERTNAQLQQASLAAEAARLEADQASRAKSDFLATMSHEIRTPINAMVGYTDLMELGIAGPLSEQQHDYVTRIRRSGEHLVTVVNDVLDFAKLESGQLRIAHETQDIATALSASVSMLNATAVDKGITVNVACAGGAYVGDGQRVQQILLNLLSNAIKFTQVGGSVRIDCDTRESRAAAHADADADEQSHAEHAAVRWLCVVVADDGVGIPADQLDVIFEPFVQAASGYTRVHGGTGLGLAISRSLARMMNGDITVESTVGSGATFTLWLPAAD